MESIRKVLSNNTELDRYKSWINDNFHTFDAIVKEKYPDSTNMDGLKFEARRLAAKHYLESIV
jgi:hypothetical protein